MKTLALVFGALMVLGAVSGAAAQTGQPAAGGSASTDVKADSSKAPSANVDVKSETRTSAPGARPGIDVNVNTTEKSESTVKSDDGAALPRGAAGGGSGTTIFGLSPTAAVIVAAALLGVVILAIVAMTRGGAETTYIDHARRPPVV